jgi:hypothetical protein
VKQQPLYALQLSQLIQRGFAKTQETKRKSISKLNLQCQLSVVRRLLKSLRESHSIRVWLAEECSIKGTILIVVAAPS